MTEQDESPVDAHPVEEEDHDLLTFAEVSDRLGVAIGEQEQRVAALEADGRIDAAQEAAHRLALMREARERHSHVAITAVNAEQFYGLEPVGERQVLRGI
jgi:hypothetical protein